jgi:hypothetical protein
MALTGPKRMHDSPLFTYVRLDPSREAFSDNPLNRPRLNVSMILEKLLPGALRIGGRHRPNPYLVAPILVTLLSPSLVTQILVPSNAMAKGKAPTVNVPTPAPVLASNLVTLLLSSSTTQI